LPSNARQAETKTMGPSLKLRKLGAKFPWRRADFSFTLRESSLHTYGSRCAGLAAGGISSSTRY